MGMGLLSILLLAPLSPFLHRFTFHIPMFLFLIFVGTLIYNLVAFPFSANNRLKVYFIQDVDLDTGKNNVSLTGVHDYVRSIMETIPSAAGQDIQCLYDTRGKAGLTKCPWEGLAPKVVKNVSDGEPPENGYRDWL